MTTIGSIPHAAGVGARTAVCTRCAHRHVYGTAVSPLRLPCRTGTKRPVVLASRAMRLPAHLHPDVPPTWTATTARATGTSVSTTRGVTGAGPSPRLRHRAGDVDARVPDPAPNRSAQRTDSSGRVVSRFGRPVLARWHRRTHPRARAGSVRLGDDVGTEPDEEAGDQVDRQLPGLREGRCLRPHAAGGAVRPAPVSTGRRRPRSVGSVRETSPRPCPRGPPARGV